MNKEEFKQQYQESRVGDYVEVPSTCSYIPLWAGEVWAVEEGEPRKVHFGDNGYYLMEKDGKIGVFR